MITYRFKITNKINGSVMGTGSWVASKEMNDVRQLSFFHEYTHGVFLKQESYVKIEIWKVTN